MPELVRITKRGIEALAWSEVRDGLVVEPIETAVSVLRYQCRIDDDITLGDVLRAVENDPELVRFLSLYCRCDVNAFTLAACQAWPGRPSELVYIEVAKHLVWDDLEAEICVELSGIWGSKEHGEFANGLDYTPLEELVGLPMKLCYDMEVTRDHEDAGEAPCTFRLLDIVAAVYSDLSVHGDPDKRADEVEAFKGPAGVAPFGPPSSLVN